MPTKDPAVLKSNRDSVEVTPYDRTFSKLLSLVGRIPPAAWDAIIPHGPRLRVTTAEGPVARAALNPQPLPPREAFLTTAAELTHEVVRAAVAAEMQGAPSSALISDLIDDWCPAPWPRRWPWPWPGPRPDEKPIPEPWDMQTARVVAAVIFASMASRLAAGDLREALAKGADRLAEAAVAEAP